MNQQIKIVIFVILFFVNPAFSQQLKFGKISKFESDYQFCDFEPDADIVVLAKQCITSITGKFNKREVHKRFKVLKESGIDKVADQNLFYISLDNYEEITNLSAQVINYENGNKIVQKLDADEFYRTAINDELSVIRFSFPTIKVGSIVEFSYTEYFKNILFIDTWYFQSDFPVLKSIFSIKFPRGVYYKYVMVGNKLSKKYGNNKNNNGIYVLENLPSLKDEIYVYNKYNFSNAISFQLDSYYKGTGAAYSSSGYQNFYQSWKDLGDENLNKRILSNYLSNKKLKSFLILDQVPENETEKVKFYYELIQKKFTIKRNVNFYPDKDAKELVQFKEGNPAALNMLLIGLLQNENIEAYPMFISTRDHANVLTDIPLLDRFNQIVCYVKIDGQFRILTINDEIRPFNILEDIYQVREGLLLKKGKSEIIAVSPQENSSIRSNENIQLMDNDTINFNSEIMIDGYEGYLLKRKVLESDGTIKNQFNGILASYKHHLDDNLADFNSPFYIKSSNRKKTELNKSNEIFLYPRELMRFMDQPITDKQRQLPVEFKFAYNDLYLTNITYSDQYEVIDLPQNIRMTTPDKSIYFEYLINHVDNMINVRVKFKILTDIVSVDYYDTLIETFSLIENQLNSPIILKKRE